MENKPILSCAGRTSVNIDAVMLQQLLLTFKPTLIGVKERAQQIADVMHLIAIGEYDGKSLEAFKDVINEEFLQIQLMEASRLARTESVETAVDVCHDTDML